MWSRFKQAAPWAGRDRGSASRSEPEQATLCTPRRKNISSPPAPAERCSDDRPAAAFSPQASFTLLSPADRTRSDVDCLGRRQYGRGRPGLAPFDLARAAVRGGCDQPLPDRARAIRTISSVVLCGR